MANEAAANIHALRPDMRIDGMRTGTIAGIDRDGTVSVDYTDNPHGRPLAARLGAGVRARLGGWSPLQAADVLLVFEQGDPLKPVIFDLITDKAPPRTLPVETAPIIETPSVTTPSKSTPAPDGGQDLTVDGRTLTFNAGEQITLRCGKASITLTRAGKIIIRGAYLLNRSSGINRIKGGSVQIN